MYSYEEFESIIIQLSESIFKQTNCDPLTMLFKTISKQCKIYYNIDLLDEPKVKLSEKTSHRHSLSQRTIVTKKIIRKKVTQVPYKNSKTSTFRNNSEAVMKPFTTYEKSCCVSKILTGKHTRASSLELNLGSNSNAVQVKGTKIQKMKFLMEKLRNFQYVKEEKKKDYDKEYKQIIFLEKRRNQMFSHTIIVRLIFKAWINYVKVKLNNN